MQVNEFVKRARAAKIHAYIIGHLKKEMPSPRRGLPGRRALQAGVARVQHRQVREAQAQAGAGGGRHARVRHPGAPQELQEPVRVNLADPSSVVRLA